MAFHLFLTPSEPVIIHFHTLGVFAVALFFAIPSIFVFFEF